MDKTLFTEKLKPLGYLKRRWGGAVEEGIYEDTYLKLFPHSTDCPPCSHVEFLWKRDHWQQKCLICGEKTRVSRIVDKY